MASVESDRRVTFSGGAGKGVIGGLGEPGSGAVYAGVAGIAAVLVKTRGRVDILAERARRGGHEATNESAGNSEKA